MKDTSGAAFPQEVAKMREYQKTRHDRHLGCRSVDGHGMRGYCDCWDKEKLEAEKKVDALLTALQVSREVTE